VIALAADPSRRAYVRKINISGNNRTRDEVIRREFRQFESSWYDGDKIKLSRDRVDRLGYFKSVDVDTSDVPGTNDQVDVNIKVEEKPTGNFVIGAGFSSSDKLSLQLKVQQENVFGSGNYLGVDFNTSKTNRVLAFNAIDPYFTKDGVSRTVDVYFRSQKPIEADTSNYQLNTRGGSLRFGVPFSEQTTVFFGAGLEQTEIVPGTNIPATYLAYANQAGLKSTLAPLTVGWSSDTRDSALAPNKGILQRLSGEWGVGGDAKYLRGSYEYQHYFPLNKQFTLAINGEFGWGKGLGNSLFPVFKTYSAGGLGSVRGFEQGTLGPRDITGAYLGGPKKLLGAVEVQTPFPGAGNDRTLRMFGFFDIGNVFGEKERYAIKDMRASAGVGLSWISPVGPLRLAVANPVRKRPGDKIQKLQFQIGSTF
jgi:outer membrane protein insertion porin family